MPFDVSARRVGVFIDIQNMYYSARNIYGSKVHFPNIVAKMSENRRLIRAIAYTVSTKTGEEVPFFEALHKSGIEVNTRELLEYDSGHRKGDWDVGITVDIIKGLDMYDEIVLVSGDGDYVALGNYLKERGRIFHVASFRESTSTKLVECADIYTNFSEDLATYLIRDPSYRTRQERKSSATDTFDDVIAEQSEYKFASSAPVHPTPLPPLPPPPTGTRRRGRPRKQPILSDV